MNVPAVIGRYEFVRAIGEGGMGRVIVAKDTVLGRPVAIKMLRDDLGLPADEKRALVQRMREEARLTAALGHPNILALHDMGEDPEVGLFLVFEYVDGPSLRERIEEGRVPPIEVARMARELGAALAYAHDAGIVHRDVKPENVLLSPTGAKLSDLGIARARDSVSALSATTAAYSAPEALATGEFGPAADQFSLAATMYEALAGRPAFVGEDQLAVAAQIADPSPPPLPREARMDARVDDVLGRALSKLPERRFTSCRAFAEALAIAIEMSPMAPREGSDAPPASRRSIVPRSTRRTQNVIAGVAVVVIVSLILLGPKGDASDGVSLKSVAASFAAVLASTHAAGAAGTKAGAAEHDATP